MQNCPRHPTIPSTDLCVECGDFVCGQCATVLADRRVLCPNCNERLGAFTPSPPPPEPEAPKASHPTFEAIDGGRARKRGAAVDQYKPSGRATAAMILGLLSCACFPAAILAIVLGLQELSAIKEGRAPRVGKTQATVGIALGCVTGFLFVIWIIAAPVGGK